MRSSDGRLIRESAERLYGEGQRIWDPLDRWNAYKRVAINSFAERHARVLVEQAETILDAGCGSEPYAWLPARTVSLDRYKSQLRDRSKPIVGDLERLPFDDQSIDFVVCVASVLNYVSAAEAIVEISRVLRPGGHLLLHFETSTSFEQIFRSRWGAPVVRIDTLNSGRYDTLWIYSPSYVNALLSNRGLSIKQRQAFHIGSALALRFGIDQQASARLAALDGFLRVLRLFGDDTILLAEKLA